MAVLPITPKQVREQALENIPDEVIEAVNTLLAKNYSGNYAIITQDDIIELAVANLGIERKEFNFKWLDFEDLYRKNGWEVTYDNANSHYTDNYKSFFRFDEL